MIFVVITTSAYSQRYQDITKRFFVGTDFGFFLGNVSLIQIGPHVGYKILPPLSFAFGGTYMFYNDSRFNPNLRTSSYGIKSFLRYNFFQNYIAQLQYESLNVEKQYYGNFRDSTGRFWTEALYIGGGYSAEFSNRFSSYLFIGVNLNDNFNTPFQNPKIEIGFEYQFK